MSFSSYTFILLFLPVCILASAALKRWSSPNWILAFLLVSSCAFLAVAGPWYVLVYLGSAAGNWLVFLMLARDVARKRLWLSVGVALNLMLLGFFKYTDFAVANINSVLGTELPFLKVALPLGLSFLTFQQVAFIVDAYRGQVTWRGVRVWLLTVLFFPKIPSGPILRHDQSTAEWASPGKAISWVGFSKGLTLLAIGLFKKTEPHRVQWRLSCLSPASSAGTCSR